MLDNEKIIFYLIFAKSKLNPKSNIHRKSIHEINELIEELKGMGGHK